MVRPVHVKTHEWGIDYFCPSHHKKPGKNRIFALQWQADISYFMLSFLHTYL